jgi:hypothetical protein
MVRIELLNVFGIFERQVGDAVLDEIDKAA